MILPRSTPENKGRAVGDSERPPRPCSTVTGQHGQGYDELQHPEQRLIQHIPGRSVRGEHPAQGQHGRYYAKRPEKEGHKDQPERPAPASDHAYAEQGEERRDRYEEEEPGHGRREPQGAAVDFRRRSEELHQPEVRRMLFARRWVNWPFLDTPVNDLFLGSVLVTLVVVLLHYSRRKSYPRRIGAR